jgi:AcrR family transcriptional regulator
MPKHDSSTSLRRAAIASARERFLQWGFSGASIASIAEDLGVTKAALYYHFPDKEALFLAVFDEYLVGVAAELAGLLPLFSDAPEPGPFAAFSALAKVFLSRGETSARMDSLAFQESPHLGEEGRRELGERYHRDLVRPLGACFEQAERAHWIRPQREGEPARVWLFMGLLSAFFAPGHAAGKVVYLDTMTVDRAAAAFALALLDGIGARQE